MLRKNIEKSAKIKDFGSPKPPQNPPKIHPKSMSQKTNNFSSIFARILMFVARASIKKSCAHAVFCWCFTQFSVSLLACIFGLKNLPKTLPKQGPNPSKIDAKNMLCFNVNFFRFRPRFWRVLGLQDGAKLALIASKLCRVGLVEPS